MHTCACTPGRRQRKDSGGSPRAPRAWLMLVQVQRFTMQGAGAGLPDCCFQGGCLGPSQAVSPHPSYNAVWVPNSL